MITPFTPYRLGRLSLSLSLSVAALLYGTLAAAQATPNATPPAATGDSPVADSAGFAPGATDATAPADSDSANVAGLRTAPLQTEPAAQAAADATAPPSAVGSDDEADAQAEASAQQAIEELSDEAGKVNAYGFMDFTYSHMLSDRSQMNVPPAWYPSFYVGNFNLYLGSNLGKNFRTLGEVRFTYLPDGNQVMDATGATSRTNAAAADYADYAREVKVGGVIIERAYLEYEAHPLLTIRGGQWLTPYGIWNVEHGTTVIVGTTRPYVVGANLFPARQTGLEIYGSQGFSSTQVGYHLTLSNGRGPVDSYRDLDKNKAVGWRLWVQQDSDFGTFTLGTSGYKGRYTDRLQTVTFPNMAWTYEYPVQSEYRELALAADLKWTYKGALLQGEAILRDMAYEGAGRPPPMGAPGGTWTPDNRTMGLYALGGYRLPWMGIMPYLGGEYYYQSKIIFMPDSMAIWGGLNVRPTDRVVFKLQYTHAWFPTTWLDGWKTPTPLNQLIAQAAWSF
jgi:hypothetical protein